MMSKEVLKDLVMVLSAIAKESLCDCGGEWICGFCLRRTDVTQALKRLEEASNG